MISKVMAFTAAKLNFMSSIFSNKNQQPSPESSYARKKTADTDILITTRNGDKNIT